VDLGECARIWKGGCIIRAGFLDRIKAAYVRDPDLPNLLVDSDFASELNRRQASWRRIVSLCVASGISAPALSNSLNYFDSYRRERLPASLTQVSGVGERGGDASGVGPLAPTGRLPVILEDLPKLYCSPQKPK